MKKNLTNTTCRVKPYMKNTAATATSQMALGLEGCTRHWRTQITYKTTCAKHFA
jgi:hypothetical protein